MNDYKLQNGETEMLDKLDWRFWGIDGKTRD